MTITFNTKRLLELAADKGDDTSRAIAERVGLDEGSVSRYLSGKRQPSFPRAALIAQAYGVDLEELTLSAVAA